MIETYVLAACVLGLGVALTFHRLSVVARFEALEDTIRDLRGTAEKADRVSRRLDESQNSNRDGVRSTV